MNDSEKKAINPFFSIGIAAYKGEHLDACLRSVFQQTFKDFEVIFLDDCSPYNLTSIVEKFDDRRLFCHKNFVNVGANDLVKNWNYCLSKARGNLFFILGDDDELEPDYLDKIYEREKECLSVDVFHCRSKLIDENSRIIGITSGLPEYESVYDNIWHRIRGYRQQFVSDFVYRTEKLKKLGGFIYLPMAWGSDDITSYAAMRNSGIAHVNQTLLRYRINVNSISYGVGKEIQKIAAILEKGKWLKDFLQWPPVSGNDSILYHLIIIEYVPYIQTK